MYHLGNLLCFDTGVFYPPYENVTEQILEYNSSALSLVILQYIRIPFQLSFGTALNELDVRSSQSVQVVSPALQKYH